MSEKEPNSQSDFMIEKIKERPFSKRKLIRRMLITVTMAVLFGLVACFTFLALEPVLSNWMNPKEKVPQIYFPEEVDEMSPEDMLADNIPINTEDENLTEEGVVLEKEQIQEILSGVKLNLANYRQLYTALSDFSRMMQKSMVTITGVTSSVDWMNDVNESTNKSSGVIIANNTKELLILTDYSPLAKSERLSVTFCNGAEVTAEFKQKDATTNLAVVTVALDIIPKTLLDSISIANPGSSNSRTLEGTPVIALGSPMGNMNSIGYGMITSSSGVATDVDVNYKLLQTDIIGSQKAGGVIFNLQGQLIGIICMEHAASDMKNQIVAYGISDLKKRMEKLSNGHEFAYLGVYGTSVNLTAHEELKMPYGTYVTKVEMDSPAMHAGVRQGDVIVQMNDKPIDNMNDYITAMSVYKPDQAISVTVMRQVQSEYKEMNLELVLSELK